MHKRHGSTLALVLPADLIDKLTKCRPVDAQGDWHFTHEELLRAVIEENTARMHATGDTSVGRCRVCFGRHAVGKACGVTP